MSVALQRHRGISRAMICASACTHDLLQSAVPPRAVVPSRQEALDGGITLTIFAGCEKLTGNLLVANLGGSPILRWLLSIKTHKLALQGLAGFIVHRRRTVRRTISSEKGEDSRIYFPPRRGC